MVSPTLTELEEELKRDPRSRRFFDLAREYQRSGRLAEAMGLCEKGLNSYPNHWQARLLLAQIYVTKGNLEAGRDMVGKVLLAMHDSVPANHLAAEIYWALGDKDRALKHYQIVDLLEPGRAGVRERLAELLLPPPAPTAPAAADEEEPLDFQPLEEPAAPPPPQAPVPQALVFPQRPEAQAATGAAVLEPLPQGPSAPVAMPSERMSEPQPELVGLPESAPAHEEAAPGPEVQEAPWQEEEDHGAELEADTASFATVLEPAGPEAAPAHAVAPLEPEAVPFTEELPLAEQASAISDEVPLSEEELAAPGSGEAAEAGMNTFTLAELYERQGYPEKAVEIYQRMLLREPENASIHARIRTLMQRMVGEAPEAPAVHQEDVEKALRQKRVLALQAWLRRVREGRNV
jgi:tetratricopeptide (TPR) repeat protein